MPNVAQRSIFTKKHYDWLAKWAGRNLSWMKINLLIDDLTNDNKNFDPVAFGERVLEYKINS